MPTVFVDAQDVSTFCFPLPLFLRVLIIEPRKRPCIAVRPRLDLRRERRCLPNASFVARPITTPVAAAAVAELDAAANSAVARVV